MTPQTELLDAGICTEEKVAMVTEERIIPEVGRRQVHFEKTLENMDVSHLDVIIITPFLLFKELSLL